MDKEDILSNLLKKCVGWTFRSDDADEVLEIYKHEVKVTERLQQENKKYKEVIEKTIKWVIDYKQSCDFNDEVWNELNDLLIILKEVK